MAKQILVACGNGIATSTVVATKIRNYLSEQGIDAETTQTRLTEVPGKVANYDLFSHFSFLLINHILKQVNQFLITFCFHYFLS